MNNKDSELVTNKEFSEDFKKIDKLENETKKKNNSKDKSLKSLTKDFSFDENDIDNNLI